MGESNIIDKLPNEMVMKIFGHLDPISLDNAASTCKRWKERIEELCLWPWKIDLKVHNIIKWKDLSQITNRKCNKLAIRTYDTTNSNLNDVAKIIKTHGSEIVELFLSQSYWSTNFLVTIMNQLSKLKHLIIMDTELKATKKAFELPEFKALKTVQLVNSRGIGLIVLIDCLTKANLETLQIRDCDISMKSVTDLLKTQKNLKTLALRFEDNELRETLKTLDETMPFKLTNLSLRLNIRRPINITKFMVTQSQTVKSLESRGIYSNCFYETVLSKFSSLKSLCISITELPTEPNFYERLQAKNITTLILVDIPNRFYLFPTCLSNFLSCVPNITDLTVDVRYYQEAIKYTNTLKHIEKLSIRQIIPNAVHFPKLHTLNIKDLALNSSWYNFVKKNTQIRNLTVNMIRSNSTMHPIEHIKKFINSIEPLRLKKLSIGKRYPTIPVAQSIMSIFDELPFCDENLFNRWLAQEFWTDEICFGSLKDKRNYDGRNFGYEEQYEKYHRYFNYEMEYVQNVFEVLEKDLKKNERMAVKARDIDAPFPFVPIFSL